MARTYKKEHPCFYRKDAKASRKRTNQEARKRAKNKLRKVPFGEDFDEDFNFSFSPHTEGREDW